MTVFHHFGLQSNQKRTPGTDLGAHQVHPNRGISGHGSGRGCRFM